jgi:hypothetical protein
MPPYASRYPPIEGVTPSLEFDVDADPEEACDTHVARATYDFGAASADRLLAVTLVPEYDAGAPAPRAWSAEISGGAGSETLARSEDAFETPEQAVDRLERALPTLDDVPPDREGADGVDAGTDDPPDRGRGPG